MRRFSTQCHSFSEPSACGVSTCFCHNASFSSSTLFSVSPFRNLLLFKINVYFLFYMIFIILEIFKKGFKDFRLFSSANLIALLSVYTLYILQYLFFNYTIIPYPLFIFHNTFYKASGAGWVCNNVSGSMANRSLFLHS